MRVGMKSSCSHASTEISWSEAGPSVVHYKKPSCKLGVIS
jgi:hypothetical protein